MTPMQQMLLGVGAKKKVYMDDVFSTYLYKGNGGAHQIVNGIDNTEESMIWFKNRTATSYPQIHDTIRGGQNWLLASESNAAGTDSGYHINTFNNNGFTLQNGGGGTNMNNHNFASWNFKSAPGFFDVVTYTGNGTGGRAISHSLGSVPGCIMVKCTSDDSNWRVYHRGNGTSSVPAEHWALSLNQNVQAADGPQYFNDTLPTSTHFTVGDSSNVNDNAKTYVAYLFGGGESNAATARSVDFDGSDDLLYLSSTSDFNFGTGDFTIECWAKPADTSGATICSFGPSGSGHDSPSIQIKTNQWHYYNSSAGHHFVDYVQAGQWTHLAVCRSSGVTKYFINGTLKKSFNDSYNIASSDLAIGAYSNDTQNLDGAISNFRVVKGTAVYTSSFRPPTEPLTNITNTKLLCCNNSSVTGSTVTPGTITAYGTDIAASSDSPFDDPAGFVFGENGDENIIKTGSYIGNANADGPEIYLGWEPQWILLKNADSNNSWRIYDSMRGIITGGDDELIHPDSTGAAYSGGTNEIDLTSTGFKVVINDSGTNTNNGQYTYMAVRRSDGYVGKPAELGTDVFNVVYGNSSSTIPNFPSNFPVDMAIYKEPTTTYSWYTHTRLTGGKSLKTDSTDAQSSGTDADATFDSNAGWGKFGYATGKASWLWKRHAGFDCIAYKGDGVEGRQLRHNLTQSPQMIWIKSRSSGYNWVVWHKDLTSGKHMVLNTSGVETTSDTPGLGTVSSVSFNVGSQVAVNQNNNDHIAMLFASVSGVSAVGSYTGNGSSTGPSISLGFQPRFILFRGTDMGGPWRVLDTLRDTLGSGTDKELSLNNTSAQADHTDWLDITSNGFDIKSGDGEANASGKTYIYYCHA